MSADMEPAVIIPCCGTKLRPDALRPGEETWIGTQRKGEADAKETSRIGSMARRSTLCKLMSVAARADDLTSAVGIVFEVGKTLQSVLRAPG